MTTSFTGHIAGLGTSSGVRLVVGVWDTSPFGAFADVMVEDASGHRTLLAPRQSVADAVASVYSFDEVRISGLAPGTTLCVDVIEVGQAGPGVTG